MKAQPTRTIPAAPGTDPGWPRFGMTPAEWEAINRLAWRVMLQRGLHDWPGYERVPHLYEYEPHPRLIFLRHLVRTGIVNEGRRWDGTTY